MEATGETLGSGRRCIACGATGRLTLEHVLPQWLSRTVAGQQLIADGFPSGPHLLTRMNSETGDLEEVERGRRTSPFNTTVRALCANCNGGWMSALEADFMPIFAEMQSRVQLASEEIEVAIRWAIKTTVTFQMHDPGSRVVPDLALKPLITKDVPTQRFAVFTFLSDDPNLQARMNHFKLSGQLKGEFGNLDDYAVDMTVLGMQGVGFVVVYLTPWDVTGFGAEMRSGRLVRLQAFEAPPMAPDTLSSETDMEHIEIELWSMLLAALGFEGGNEVRI